ncbi:MAG: hypothetical protein ACLFQA_00085 [Bacteroidales bacterium]
MKSLQKKVELKFLDYRLIYAGIMIFILVSMPGCSSEHKQADVEHIDLEIDIKRLEKDLFEIDIDSISHEINTIENKYGDFFDIFNNLIIRIGSHSSPAYEENLKSFLTDFDIYRLYNEVETVFPGIETTEKEIETGFRYFLNYFPDYPIPQIYTFISGFNQSVVTADSILAFGLDKYLGRDHRFYSELQLPVFRRKNMYPEKIPSDCMIGWAMTEFEFDEKDENLLGNMIYHGKMLYFADLVLPHQHDTLKVGFTNDELEWCRNNETNMWTYLVENKLLFSTDALTIGQFINEGPFTRGFSRESPARAAVWLGWQIVDSYMERNSHVNPEELMLDADYQRILNSARYKP